MTREEKKNYVLKNTNSEGDFTLADEQERVKFLLMSEFVRIRKQKGITQEELSQRTGIARPNVARMENGSYNPTIDMMVRLATGIDMHLDIKLVENK